MGSSIPRKKIQNDTSRRYALWDALSDFGSSAADEALRYCMKSICAWIGADNAFWLGTVRMVQGKHATTDSRSGWRIGAIEALKHARTSHRRIEASKQVFRSDDPGDTTRAVLAGAGSFRVHSLRTGLVDLRAFQKTEHYDFFYRKPGIRDRIWVVFPINADTESCFCFDRYGSTGQFSANALNTAAETLRGIKWFHRQLLLSHGLGVSIESITPAERRVLRELLSGAPEKEIAARLGLTPATTHQYVARIFRKFGVSGRANLMSLWVSKIP